MESREVFAHAAWILSSTERAVVASGIANIWARDPTAMANGWRMLSDAYPGRFVLGIGVSHAGSVARRGGTYERPYSAMREYLDAMDRAPSAAPEPESTPRLVLAALGPRMLELAAERAHGVHPYFVPVEHTAFARQRLGPGPVLAVEQTVVFESDPSEARRVARGFALDYLQTENYARNLRRVGWTDADVAGQGSDALIDAVVRVGRRRPGRRARATAPRRGRGPRLRPGGRRGRARPVPPAAPRARARAARALGQRARGGARTASLRSSRRASRAIHLADRCVHPPDLLGGPDGPGVELGAALADLPKRPGDRLLHVVAVVGRLLADHGQQRTRTRASGRSLRWTAAHAMSANAARFSNSGSRALHSTALSSANGVRSNRLPQTPSQTSHESRSATHASICAFDDPGRLVDERGEDARLVDARCPERGREVVIVPEIARDAPELGHGDADGAVGVDPVPRHALQARRVAHHFQGPDDLASSFRRRHPRSDRLGATCRRRGRGRGPEVGPARTSYASRRRRS